MSVQVIYKTQGKLGLATELLVKAVEVRKSQWGEGHVDYINTLEALIVRVIAASCSWIAFFTAFFCKLLQSLNFPDLLLCGSFHVDFEHHCVENYCRCVAICIDLFEMGLCGAGGAVQSIEKGFKIEACVEHFGDLIVAMKALYGDTSPEAYKTIRRAAVCACMCEIVMDGMDLFIAVFIAC